VEGVVRGNYWQNLQVRTEGSGEKWEYQGKKKEIIGQSSFEISHLSFGFHRLHVGGGSTSTWHRAALRLAREARSEVGGNFPG